MSLNTALVMGNAADLPEFWIGTDNKRKASFKLATNEHYKNKSGEVVQQTEWHKIVCWNNLADIAQKIIYKGCKVFVQGKICTRDYEDKDGKKVYITEIIAENLQLCSPLRDDK
jgi:single-strand DNA-binding protein